MREPLGLELDPPIGDVQVRQCSGGVHVWDPYRPESGPEWIAVEETLLHQLARHPILAAHLKGDGSVLVFDGHNATATYDHVRPALTFVGSHLFRLRSWTVVLSASCDVATRR